MLEYFFFIGILLVVIFNFISKNQSLNNRIYIIYLIFGGIAAIGLSLTNSTNYETLIIGGYLFSIFGFLTNFAMTLFFISFISDNFTNKFNIIALILATIYVMFLLVSNPFNILTLENGLNYIKLKPYAYIPSMILTLSFFGTSYVFYNFSKNAGKKRKYFIIFAACISIYNLISVISLILEFIFEIRIINYLVYFASLFSIIALYSYYKISQKN